MVLDEKMDRAQQLLNDTLFNEAFDVVEERCIEEWQLTNVHDVETRENAFKMLQAARAVRNQVRSYIDDGKLKGKNITEIKKKGWL